MKKEKPIREFKGKRLMSFTDDYVVIDIETTGLDPQIDSIIEVGAIRYRGGTPVADFSSLINPGFEIDDYISELTGITNLELAAAPEIENVLPQYLAFIGSDLVLGHNVNFDINFVYDSTVELDLPPISNDYCDTMFLSRRLFPDQKHHRLCDLVDRFGISADTTHRALADCRSTAACYAFMLNYAQQNGIDPSSPKYVQAFKAQDIIPTVDSFDVMHPLFGQTCVFTGALERMHRKQAMQLVVDAGGHVADRITKDTNYLILGNNDYCSSIKGGKSNKQKTAEKYKLGGQDIEIISENVFYDMLALFGADRSDAVIQMLSEEDALTAIMPELEKVLEKHHLPPSCISIEKRKTYHSLIFCVRFSAASSTDVSKGEEGTVIARIGGKIQPYLSVKASAFADFNQIEAVKGNPQDAYYKISLSSFNELKDYTNLICFALEWIIQHLQSEYDCCSRYAECSDAMHCIHPDPEFALLCGYRKQLIKGIIFYGENRTIE